MQLGLLIRYQVNSCVEIMWIYVQNGWLTGSRKTCEDVNIYPKRIEQRCAAMNDKQNAKIK